MWLIAGSFNISFRPLSLRGPHDRLMRLLHTADWARRQVPKQPARRAGAGAARDRRRTRGGRGTRGRRPVRQRAPSVPAQQLVVRTLLALAGTGAEVIAIAGNPATPLPGRLPAAGRRGRDHPGRLGAHGRAGRCRAVHRPLHRRAGQGGRAALPLQRYAAALRTCWPAPGEHTRAYDQLRDILGTLTAGFADDVVNLVLAHHRRWTADGRRRANRTVDLRVRGPAGIFRNRRA